MTKTARPIGSLIPWLILGTVLVLYALQVLMRAPIDDSGPIEFGEGAAYLAISAASFLAIATLQPVTDLGVLIWAATGVSFLGATGVELAGLDNYSWTAGAADDVPGMVVWLMIGLGWIIALRHPGCGRREHRYLLIGFALCSLAVIVDMGDGSIFNLPRGLRPLSLSADDVLNLAGLGAYLCGLLLVALPVIGPAGEAGKRPGGATLYDWFDNGAGRHAAIALAEIRFWLWRLRHPDATFAAYYAGSISRVLDGGGRHKTLGQRRFSKATFLFDTGSWTRDRFAQRGRMLFEALKSFGVTPESVVAEYGCGSLRVGQHFVRYLAPEKFWGLDLVDRFYQDGMALIGADTVAEKRPNLHVISERTLVACRAAGPDLIYSTAVMKHVPEAELDTYWRRLLSLMKPGSTAVVEFDAAPAPIRTSGKNWAYPEEFVAARIRRFRPDATIRFHVVDLSAKAGGRWRRLRVVVT